MLLSFPSADAARQLRRISEILICALFLDNALMSEPIKFTFAPKPIKEREDNLPEYPAEAVSEKSERTSREQMTKQTTDRMVSHEQDVLSTRRRRNLIP